MSQTKDLLLKILGKDCFMTTNLSWEGCPRQKCQRSIWRLLQEKVEAKMLCLIEFLGTMIAASL